ncbi:hypothetical protein [Niabella ginsenosidivorans]|uniref:hypothetical protein n=1 Tax=Niabella ginsenosidivorans TaxID=1176587 RepID=UPI0012EDA10F|nr:hypothetical protein [Niabella ginsenosidivorans]
MLYFVQEIKKAPASLNNHNHQWYRGNTCKIDKSAIMSVKNELQLKHRKNGYLQFLGIFFICGVGITVLLFIYMLLQLV